MSIFTKVWSWLKSKFVTLEQHAAHVAVAVGEIAKEALQNGTLDVAAKIVDFITKSNLGDEVEAALKVAVPKIIAISIAIETHPTAGSSVEDVLAWEVRILNAFNVHSNKSMVYSLIAAQTFGVLNSLSKNPTKPTLAQWIKAVEEIYSDYQTDVANA